MAASSRGRQRVVGCRPRRWLRAFASKMSAIGALLVAGPSLLVLPAANPIALPIRVKGSLPDAAPSPTLSQAPIVRHDVIPLARNQTPSW